VGGSTIFGYQLVHWSRQYGFRFSNRQKYYFYCGLYFFAERFEEAAEIDFFSIRKPINKLFPANAANCKPDVSIRYVKELWKWKLLIFISLFLQKNKMQILNLPRYNFAVKKVNSKLQIFDSQRKKYVTLTPEEWVRQHFVRFLIEEKHFPSSRLAVEYTLKIKDMERRCDIVVFAKNGKPQIIIEIKAPQIILNQAVFDQIAIYNSQLNVDYYIISNGLEHYCCRVDRENSRYEFLPEIPDYQFFQ